MSALLSTDIYGCFSSTYDRDYAFKVSRLRYSQHAGMVFGLATVFQNSNNPVRILRCGREEFHHVGGADVVRTGAGHEYSAWPEHLQSSQIQLFVAAQRGFAVLP